MMPGPVTLFATAWSSASRKVAQDGTLSWLRPDAKSQVTCRLLTTQGWSGSTHRTFHPAHPDISLKDLREAADEKSSRNVIPSELLHAEHSVPYQPDRQLRDWGPGRRLRPDPAATIIVGTPRRRHWRACGGAFSGQGPVQG